jgi:hypothetical protein
MKKLVYSMQQNEMNEPPENDGMLPTIYPGSTKRSGNLNQSFNFGETLKNP